MSNTRTADGIPPLVPQDRLLTSDEVCRILSIRRLHLYELLRRGELRSVRIGRRHRFIPSDVELFIANGIQGRDTRSEEPTDV
ncbi:MAG TPA: helix-turn-helix domain-containing protein [Gemmatimonadaceae bacterium]|nr:helix-turn-helix domain-containing protein [Gemmatimonadaceae bacterium]